MRVIFVDTAALTFGGGYENFLMRAAANAALAGHDVTVVTPMDRLANAISLATNLQLLNRNMPYDDVHDKLGGGRLVKCGPLDARRAFAGAEVVYAKNEPQEIAFAAHAMPPTARLIVGFHSSVTKYAGVTARFRNGLYNSSAYRGLFRSVDAIHLLQEHQRPFVVDHLGFPPEHVWVIGNGVDRRLFAPGAQNGHGDEFKVLFAGRLSLQKGADVLLAAIQGLNSAGAGRGIEFTVAGDGPFRADFERLANRSPNVTYTGFASRVEELYRSHDLVVVPSRWETFGLVPAEALSCGVTVALSTIVDFEPFTEAGATYFTMGDARALRDAVLELHREWREHPQVFGARRNRALEFSARALDAEDRYRDLVRMLEGVVQQGARR